MERGSTGSEIRSSTIRELLDKARKRNYAKYLASLRLERIRFFKGAEVTFDFPVTALIGPNGGGKSTILGAAASAYYNFKPESFFQRSFVGDGSMDDWLIEYDIIDKAVNPKGMVKSTTSLKNNTWSRSTKSERSVTFFSINRTVPVAENPGFTHKRRLRFNAQGKRTLKARRESAEITMSTEPVDDIDHIKTEAERILGKSLAYFKLLRIKISTPQFEVKRTRILDSIDVDELDVRVPVFRKKVKVLKPLETQKLMFVGSDGENEYSEFNFGAGEASVIHLVADAESLPDNSLILIEEIENGLHPVAVRRLVEYFIDVSKRKKLQVVFTTHSDHAISPLPSEAIWAAMDGRVEQGKLSIEMLRAVSGRIDKRLAIFVEDEFARLWIEAIIREELSDQLEEIGVYSLSGDGNAVRIHLGHMSNPAISFHSMCFIDGDSDQDASSSKRIFRLPGSNPEITVFNSVIGNMSSNIAYLTVACQRGSDKQALVARTLENVSRTNRDPHLLFSQVGIGLGLLPEAIVVGAFFSTWISENRAEAEGLANLVKNALELPPKTQM
jgi:energy-coupling factor transporter ATP-binding protein EcfA2